MDREYAGAYRELYGNHWWWRARESLILAELRRRLPPVAQKPRALLDVGCGDGLFFDKLAEFGDVDGVEADPSLVDPCGPHAERIHIGPFGADFRPCRRYDLILMLDVVEHLPDAEAGLRRAAELLNDDGLLIVTVPAFNALWTAHDDFNLRLVLRDVVRGQETAPVHAGINHRAATDDAAGVQHAVAADFLRRQTGRQLYRTGTKTGRSGGSKLCQYIHKSRFLRLGFRRRRHVY